MNPTVQQHSGKVSSGDFAIHMRELLQDPSKRSIPIHFPYSYNHPFWNNFRLIFSLDSFSQRELSSVIPTLSYSYSGIFTSDPNHRTGLIPRVEYKDLIASLFSADVLFSQMKNRLAQNYDLLHGYFSEYLQSSSKDKFTIRYLKELYHGFGKTQSNIGNDQDHGYLKDIYINDPKIKAELKGTKQTFWLRDSTGKVNEAELKRMIVNILYYTNQYESIAEIIEGTGNTGKSALILNPYKFLTPNYFSSTYALVKKPHQLSAAASQLYTTQYSSMFSYSLFYNALSDSGMLAGYLLQGGNNLRMRDLYDNYFQMNLIVDLGYMSLGL